MTSQALDPISQFEAEKSDLIKSYGGEAEWKKLSNAWVETAFHKRYMYNFAWMGRPIIQIPTDMVAIQEIIWNVKPDLVIETGIAHGGSLVMSASMLALLDLCEAAEAGGVVDPRKSKRKVLGLDIDIRAHNRKAIETHPMASYIELFQGSSIEQPMIDRVHAFAAGYKRVLVCLDSNHTHDHVMAELEAYAPLASKGSYCIVFDTIVEDLPADMFPTRPWKPGDNPKTAVWEYLKLLKSESRTGSDGAPLNFEIDEMVEGKLLLSVAPNGYLKRV